MYVCVCNAVTDSQIRRAIGDGVTSLWGLQSELGVAAGCGSCTLHAMDVLRDELADAASAAPAPRIYRPTTA